jgi:tetratricopeptide (TPR) repeat protein
MRKVSSRLSAVATVAFAVVIGVTAAGCAQVGALKGQMAFKEANGLYQAQKYKDASVKYEEAIEANPELADAYFFLANSYDNQYRATKKGDAENDALLTKAIDNYKKRSEMDAGDPKIKRLALEYLVNAFGPDKLNDPSQQEPILMKMAEADPGDTTAWFGLANIYEQSGDYERAEQMLVKAREAKPNDPAVYMQLAGFYNRQGEFDKTMEALHARAEREPTNPEAFYVISTYYWEKAYRDFTLPAADQMKFVQEGLKAVDKALELNTDYVDALTYKNLLLRVQARLEKNPADQQRLLAQAKQFEAKAIEVRNKQRAASGAE